MATTFTFSSAADTWPAGTSVGAYPRANQQTGWDRASAPSGSAAATGTVASDGSLTFSGLSEDTAYYAGAQVSSAWRFKAFRTSAAAAGSVSVTAADRPWLVVDGNQIREGVNGPRYRTTGWNSYVMKVAGGTVAQTMNAAQRDAFMARLRPNSLLRIWFYAPVPPSYTWAQVLAELDAIVASAKKYGHRIVAGLTDWWAHANDAFTGAGTAGAKTQAWFTANTWRTSVSGSASLQAWTETVAARYASEPTVCAYDLMNEPQDSGAVFTADIVRYTQEMAGYVKAANPNALCYMGVQGATQVGGQTAYQTIFSSTITVGGQTVPTLDFCGLHEYTAGRAISTLAATMLAVRATGKPLLIDEFGAWAKGYYDLTDVDNVNGLGAVSYEGQARLLGDWMRRCFDLPEVFGTLVWSAMDTDASWFDGLGHFEPPNDAPIRTVLKDIAIPDGAGVLNDKIGGMASITAGMWIDSLFSARHQPGVQIGGPASGNTNLSLIYDRLNTQYRQSTQASAPFADVYTDITGRQWSSMRFAGSHHFGTSTLTGTGTAHTVFAVFSPSSVAAIGYLLVPNTSTTVGLALRVNASGQLEIYKYGTGGAVIAATTAVLTVGQLYAVVARWDASSGSYAMRLNGALDVKSGTSTATPGNDVYRVGAETAGTNGFNGHLLEIGKTNQSLSAADQGRLLGYLQRKYGRAVAWA